MKNIEFKAELRDLEAARRQCALLGAERVGHLRQTDEYYRLTQGRLKRRTAPGEPTEWIMYERCDRTGARASEYDILSEVQARRRWGTESLRPWLTVVKIRELWMLDGVRIHLDEVDELGLFIEFEAIVSESRDERSCHGVVQELRDAFAPLLGEAIAVSYCDLKDGEDA